MSRVSILGRIVFAAIGLVGLSCMAAAQDAATFRAQLDAYREEIWRTGERSPERALALESALRKAVESAAPDERAALLRELAEIVRIQNRFDEAIPLYRAAIEASGGRGEIDFGAWIGIARALAFGDKDHNAAAAAFRAAVAAAGPSPNRKQRFDMALYLGQLQDERGDLEAALISALDTIRLAATDEERYRAHSMAGDAFEGFVVSCSYRPLVDAKTIDEAGDRFGACRRAVAAADAHYARASEIAAGAGWDFFQELSDELRLNVAMRPVEQLASLNYLDSEDEAHFDAERSDQVLVGEYFQGSASSLRDIPGAIEMLSATLSAATAEGRLDAGTAFLAGLQADVAGDTVTAVANYEEAAALLERERTSLFDPRQRGTVTEDHPDIVENFALRLLMEKRHTPAFAALESVRARGLSDLAATFETEALTNAERNWFAQLVELDSRESALLTEIVEGAIAGEMGDPLGKLDALASVRARRAAALADPVFADTLARLKAMRGDPASLAEITQAVQASGIPVIFYWSENVNVVVWAVSPAGTEVKTVLLPQPALAEKVRRVVESARRPDQPFDAAAARQLHAYLIQPFEHHFGSGEVILVPQGPLVALPFEALIDGRTGDFLAERLAVTYAPSAAFALAALQRGPIELPAVTAIYDQDIEGDTREIARLEQRLPDRLQTVSSQSLGAEGDAIARLGGAAAAHVLLHGTFDSYEPLESFFGLNLDLPGADPSNRLTAAELLAVDWGDARLVVFAACESARMNVRISNEVYGLPWAPLVGGADAVVATRWKVSGMSNAEWMPDFYASLAEGAGSPAVAAAAAMRRMISDGQSHPYYWAAPQVFGR